MDIKTLKNIVYKAAIPAMDIYSKDFKIHYKKDKSPVTEADLAVNKVITESLQKHYPDIPILSEESMHAPYHVRKEWKEYFVIDPIDGTKEFIKKNGEFTINLAYCVDNRTSLGVVFAPVKGLMFFCNEKNSYKEYQDKLYELPLDLNSQFTILKSRSHLNKETEEFINELDSQYQLVEMGSSLKFCLIAEGIAHLYPRFGPTMEWDTAAAQAILEKAGGEVVSLDTGEALIYNKQNLQNPNFIARRKNG